MKIYNIFILLILVINFSNAQTPITLSEAIEIGLENNYQIKIAEKQLAISQNNNTLKAAGRYPTVDFNLSSNNAFTRTNNPASFLPKVTNINSGLTPSLDVRWTVFDGFTFKINKNRFNELELQSEGQIQLAVEGTIQAIMQAYYQSVIQQEQLKVLEEVIDLSRSRVEYQKVRQEFAQAGSFDILQSEDAYLNDSTTLVIQKNTYQTSLLNLKLAMGIDDMNITYEPDEALNLPAENYIFEDLENKMLAENQNIRQLFIAQKLSQLNTKISEANRRYPTISLGTGISGTGSVFWQSGNNPFNNNEPFGGDLSGNLNYYLNVTGTYNIFDAGGRKRAVQNDKVEEDIAQLNIDDLKRNLSSQLKITLENYNNQLQLVKLTERLIVSSEKNLKIADERFKGSLITSFDYRSVQLNYINASQSRLNAIYNLKNTEIGLVRLIGGLVR
jgi:outer membrane protein